MKSKTDAHRLIKMIPGGRLSKRWVLVLRSLAPFARPHRCWLLKGILAAFLVVGFRLALPWPFRLMLDPWVSGQTLQLGGALSWIPIEINPSSPGLTPRSGESLVHEEIHNTDIDPSGDLHGCQLALERLDSVCEIWDQIFGKRWIVEVIVPIGALSKVGAGSLDPGNRIRC